MSSLHLVRVNRSDGNTCTIRMATQKRNLAALVARMANDLQIKSSGGLKGGDSVALQGDVGLSPAFME
jgi:hypothetical protein